MIQDRLEISVAEKDAAAPQALRVPSTLKGLIEALVFAAAEPLSVRQLKAIYEYSAPQGSGEERKIDADAVRAIIAELNAEYKKSGRPYRIIQLAGGYQFATLKDYADWLGKLRREQSRKKLSQSGVETLAIIAYKQPVTKAEVESIRGVNCDYVLKTLLEKELVRVAGRAETVGRPLLYGTTREFLVHFGLNEITDLPRPREIEEILGETQFETERRMIEAQEAAEAVGKDEEDFKSRLPHIPKRKSDLGDVPVEIVERKRRKTIETRHTEELPLNAPSQESVPSEDSREDQDQRVIPLEHPVLVVSRDAGGETEHRTDSKGQEPIQQSGPHIQRQDEGLSDADLDHVVPTSGDSKTRWQTWKQKIQGFIRRLFD